MALTNEEIRLAMQTALLGEIYPDIIAIAYKYDALNKSFLIRYYLNREPSDDDYESVSEVMADFISNFKYSEFKELKEECEFSGFSLSELNPLDGFVYSRRKNY